MKRANAVPVSPDNDRSNSAAGDLPDSLESPLPATPSLRERKYAKWAWLFLLYNLIVVAWGVFVRASKSGDGGGTSWPLLDPTHDPMNGPIARLIEGSHRASTAMCGVFGILLLIAAIRIFPKGHLARKYAWVSFAFILLEGLIGAALVKFELVTTNESAFRAGVMCFHVISTFLLVSAIALSAMFAVGLKPFRFSGQVGLSALVASSFFGMLVMAVTGAFAALSHTIFNRPDVLTAAKAADAHWLEVLHPYHPYLSVTVAMWLVLAAGMMMHLRPTLEVRRWATVLLVSLGVQLGVGTLSVWLKAPYALQMIHLVLADVMFVSLVILSAQVLSVGTVRREDQFGAPTEDRPRGRDLVRAYVALTKPRVISLLLVTTAAAMFAAAEGWPGLGLLIAVMVGGYCSAGSANTLNMVIDRDIDFRMKRTSTRPTVTQSIPSDHALIFGLALAVASFGVLWAAANLLTGMLSLAGIVFYVVVYTLILKRRTWQNIVIGGAAGAVPPLVGWAAVQGSLNSFAWWMFLLIFFWTPVHFWALALLLKDDYAEAGVPMLPVVKGEHDTAVQISLYTAITAVLCAAPVLLGYAGVVYAAVATLLNLFLVAMTIKLFKKTERPQASALFHYSMLYLAILFVAVAVDQRWLIAPF